MEVDFNYVMVALDKFMKTADKYIDSVKLRIQYFINTSGRRDTHEAYQEFLDFYDLEAEIQRLSKDCSFNLDDLELETNLYTFSSQDEAIKFAEDKKRIYEEKNESTEGTPYCLIVGKFGHELSGAYSLDNSGNMSEEKLEESQYYLLYATLHSKTLSNLIDNLQNQAEEKLKSLKNSKEIEELIDSLEDHFK